jgi:hypothetical protein
MHKTIKLFVFLLVVVLVTASLAFNFANLRYLILGNAYKIIYGNAPSCNDNIKNQDEDDVDCGGVCSKCTDNLEDDVTWESVEAVEIGHSQYSLIARVSNSNPTTGAVSFKYSFNLYNSSGEVFRQVEGYDFIYPSQSKYIARNVLNVGEKVRKTDLNMSDFELKNFGYGASILNISFSESKFEFKSKDVAEFSAVAFNRSERDFDNVKAVVIVRGKDNEIALAGSADLGKIRRGGLEFFKVVWHNIYNVPEISTINAEFYVKPKYNN